MSEGYQPNKLALISDQYVFAVGNNCIKNSRSVKMLNLSSQTPSWLSMINMLVGRRYFGVGVLDNCIYAVSSINILKILYYK
jgi:kelch-like protein 2/3